MSTTPRQPEQVIAQAMLAAAAETPPAAITTEEVAALERLLAHARRDSGRAGESQTSCWPGGTQAAAVPST